MRNRKRLLGPLTDARDAEQTSSGLRDLNGHLTNQIQAFDQILFIAHRIFLKPSQRG